MVKLGVNQPQTLLFQLKRPQTPPFSAKICSGLAESTERDTSISRYTRSVPLKCPAVTSLPSRPLLSPSGRSPTPALVRPGQSCAAAVRRAAPAGDRTCLTSRPPSLGRSRAVRGLDLFDTPPVALGPLFEHEPLLAGVTTVAEPFCGKGNLVVAMRERGLTVFASDILDRGCPGSTVLDFRAMTERPPGCDVLISNCRL